MNPDIHGKTQSDLDKTGYRKATLSDEVVSEWGHSTGYEINKNTGRAEPKK